MQLFISDVISDIEALLTEEESWHCIKVLRHKTGDEITVMDGKGSFYKCIIQDANPKKCSLKILSKEFHERNSACYLHIAIAPTKNIDRIEWFVEKAVEIGIQEISFILCKNSERKIIKLDRIIKITESACKQSMQAYLPKVNELTDFSKFIDSKTEDVNGYIAHCQTGTLPFFGKLAERKQKVLCLIGPEGDFDISEVKMATDKGFEEVSLGTSRLRTETAALYACSVLSVLSNSN